MKSYKHLNLAQTNFAEKSIGICLFGCNSRQFCITACSIVMIVPVILSIFHLTYQIVSEKYSSSSSSQVFARL
jgi:hypothetical protein